MKRARVLPTAGVAAALAVALLASCTSSSSKKSNTATSTVTATPTCGGNGVMCTEAGTAGFYGFQGNGGPATQARLFSPRSVLQDTDGGIIIGDWNNHCYRKVDTAGTINAFIGAGGQLPGSTCTGPATAMQMNHPVDLAIDANGDYFIAGWHTDNILKVTRNTMTASCFAACAACGAINRACTGYPGPATACAMNIPSSLCWDAAGNMFVVDQGCGRILKIDTQTTPQVSIFAGSGAQGFADGNGVAAIFNMDKGTNAQPDCRLTSDAAGQFAYFADTFNHRIRKIDLSTADVTTIAGTGTAGFGGDGGPALSAQFNQPYSVAFDAAGNLYVADTYNYRIRRIDNAGNIATVAGNGSNLYSPDGTAALSAGLNLPSGVCISSDNTLYIAETAAHVVRKVKNP